MRINPSRGAAGCLDGRVNTVGLHSGGVSGQRRENHALEHFFPSLTLEIKPEGMASTEQAVSSLEGCVCFQIKPTKTYSRHEEFSQIYTILFGTARHLKKADHIGVQRRAGSTSCKGISSILESETELLKQSPHRDANLALDSPRLLSPG